MMQREQHLNKSASGDTATATGEESLSARASEQVHFLQVLFIFIVLYLHHSAYTTDYFHSSLLTQMGITRWLQQFAVGGFLFLSGFKIASSKLDTHARTFIRGRIARIYLPYVAALFLAFYTDFPRANDGLTPSLSHIAVHLLCLQSWLPDFFQPNVNTLWFVSTLFACYAFFLVTRRILSRDRLFVALTGVFALALFCAYRAGGRWELHLVNRYSATYLIFFAMGMLTSRHEAMIRHRHAPLLFAAIVSLVAYLLTYRLIAPLNSWHQCLLELTLLLSSCIPLHVISISRQWIPSRQIALSSAVRIVSYASLFIFLIHRSIWTVMQAVWVPGGIYQWIFICGLGTLITASCAIAMQMLYRKALHGTSLTRRQ